MNESTKIYPGGVDYDKSKRVPENRLHQISINGVELIASRIITREEVAEQYLKMLEERKENEMENYASELAVEQIMKDAFGEDYKSKSLEDQIAHARQNLEKIRQELKQNPPKKDDIYFLIPDRPTYEIYLPAAHSTFGFTDPKIMDYFFVRAMILAHQGFNADRIAEILEKETAKFNSQKRL